MALKCVKLELEKLAYKWAVQRNAESYKIGLFQNDWTPVVDDTISAVVIANFGGYTGLLDLVSWLYAGVTWVDPRATVIHPDVYWTADGTSTNTIYGYYVVDAAGLLAWAERRTSGGVIVGATALQTYTVSPRFTFRSEF